MSTTGSALALDLLPPPRSAGKSERLHTSEITTSARGVDVERELHSLIVERAERSVDMAPGA